MARQRRFIFDNDNDLPEMPATQPPETVAQLTSRLKNCIENNFTSVYVIGEVSGWRGAASSGHYYFELKGEKALISCTIWSSKADSIDLGKVGNGTQIEVRGNINLYPPSGRYQIIIQSLEIAGAGLLWKKFEELKSKLQAEGLFDESRKRKIPAYPKKIGVVTSITGAAIHDIESTLKRRAPNIKIIIHDTRVQGPGAALEIAAAIDNMNLIKDLDLLIVGRGGGSMEDLWAFNEEVVARAIVRSAIPVISAVGHEVDFTIADFVADLRAATPTAAAELVSKSATETIRRLNDLDQRLNTAINGKLRILKSRKDMEARMAYVMTRQLAEKWSRLEGIVSRPCIREPMGNVERYRQQLDGIVDAFERWQEKISLRYRNRLHTIDAQLQSLNPLAVLNRGYSIVYHAHDEHIVTAAAQAPTGSRLKIRFAKGSVHAVVSGEAAPVERVAPKPVAVHRHRVKDTDNTDDLFGDL